MKWIESDLQLAIELNLSGKRFDEIGEILNRDTRSVEMKLNRLGYHQNRINHKEMVICKNCENQFITHKKDKRKFCSKSCSAEYNNKIRAKQPKIKLKKCINCESPLNSHQYKYCSCKCAGDHKRKETFRLIEDGNTSLPEKNYKNYLIEKFGNKCMRCGWKEINPITGIVPIQLEHKDGNSENNDLKNLELLCPNHHSLTPTYGSLNKGNGRKKRRGYR